MHARPCSHAGLERLAEQHAVIGGARAVHRNVDLVLKHAVVERGGLLVTQGIRRRQRLLCITCTSERRLACMWQLVGRAKHMDALVPQGAHASPAAPAHTRTHPGQLLGQAQDGAVGGGVLKVGVVHGVARVGQRDAHGVRAVLGDRLLQRLEVACAGRWARKVAGQCM